MWTESPRSASGVAPPARVPERSYQDGDALIEALRKDVAPGRIDVSEGEIRTNTKVGGEVHRAEVTESMLEIARRVRPRLVRDGMFLVGLDLVGDRILEINVFSPGGMASATHFEGEDFTRPVLEALEERVRYMRRGSGSGRGGSDYPREEGVRPEEPERVFG